MRPLALAFAALLSVPSFAQEPAADGSATKPAIDFGKQVAPLLLERCIECHGPKEQKGHLRLDSKAALFPAGKEEDWSVQAGKPDESEFLRRIGLPLGDDDIMPNKGEPLTKAQQDVLRQWVAEGAVWPESGDNLIADALAAQVLPKLVFELPELAAAEQAAIDAAIAALREKGAVVQPVAADTRALDVNFSLLRDKVTDADLALLQPLAPVLVWLNLSRTAVSDAGAPKLAGLTQLRRLHVANTALGDAAFAIVAKLGRLEYLNAYGTNLGDAGLAAFGEQKALTQVYAWQSKVTAAGKQELTKRLPGVMVDLGDYVEERLAAAQKEIAEREARNTPVNTMCPVLEKPIDKALSVVHEGKRIAFCCAKCKAAFEKDPKKYLDKLPK